MLNRRRIDLILEKEIIEAMGCTEPAAAALAGAKAAELFGMEPESGVAVVSPNMMKNAMSVTIPNSALHGIEAAVSLGIAIRDSSAGLSVLSTGFGLLPWAIVWEKSKRRRGKIETFSKQPQKLS